MTCPVRGQCIGSVAAQAGSRQLLTVLAGSRMLGVGNAMWLAAGSVLAVRSGSMKSIALAGGAHRARGFHFPGETVDGGEHGVRLVALEDTELCVMRDGGAGRANPCSGRVWDMMSRQVMRERAEANLMAGLPPGRRVAALLASLKVRTRAHGGRSRLLQLSVADVAGYLELPVAEVERHGGVRWRETHPTEDS
jgi:hypothetical protein